jgi:hypothetical protein
MRYLFVLALMSGSATVAAANAPQSLDVINAPDIVSLAVMDNGSWRALDIDSARHARVASVDLPHARGCFRDFRAQFPDATALILRDVDICSERTLDPSFYRPRMHRRRAATM